MSHLGSTGRRPLREGNLWKRAVLTRSPGVRRQSRQIVAHTRHPDEKIHMMKRRLLGTQVAPVGLGCMGMSATYGPSDEAESTRVLERALELGVDHFDTADMYGNGENERLVGRVLRAASNRSEIILATKCGIKSDPDDPTKRSVDNTPAYIKAACERSLERLDTPIDLFYLHRITNLGADIDNSMTAMADLLAQGMIRGVGLSEANIPTIRRADAVLRSLTSGVHGIAAVQTEFSLMSRDLEQSGILRVCEELEVSVVAYSPIGRGLLGGQINAFEDLADGDFRRTLPRFHSDAIARNANIAQAIQRIAADRGASPAQIALAWVLSRSPAMLAIPGTRRVQYLEENWAANEIALSSDLSLALNQYMDSITVQGLRYAPEILKIYGLETPATLN